MNPISMRTQHVLWFAGGVVTGVVGGLLACRFGVFGSGGFGNGNAKAGITVTVTGQACSLNGGAPLPCATLPLPPAPESGGNATVNAIEGSHGTTTALAERLSALGWAVKFIE